ncbi:MAG TPA: hypothetical protein VFT82_00290 [Candidatus Paceibacterota bacterium]|nr:hypothetical protein [Candidatus Paceibacterota bacterium]
MSVEFEENNYAQRNWNSGEETPKIAGWLISHGIAKDVSGANKIQIAAACVFFALALYFAFH